MADKQWISLHQHTDISNSNYFEVVTQFKDYVAYAKEHGLHAVTSTEHGNVVRWIYRKELAEQAGLKYIHGMEAYVTMSLEGKEAYHTILLARNYDGVKEINKLSSMSFNRTDGHFYRKPRILFNELKDTFKNGNIYITTACLAGFIYQNKPQKDDTEEIRNNKKSVVQQWLDMAKLHKDMFYFEIQPHDNKEQAELNTLAIKYANLVGCHVIASNDVHALNPKHNELRMIVKKGKRNGYDSDDEFELWVKTYDEMVSSFQKQRGDFNVDIMSDEIIAQGLQSTLDIANSVEEFKLDKSHKYPKLYKDPEKEFQKRIKQGLKDRGILDKPKEERKVYLDRVKHEYEVYKHNGAIDYMLCHEDILNAARTESISFGFGRGSCFTSEAKVLMADYSTKNINKVQIGDMVIDHTGTPNRVTATHERTANTLYKVIMSGGLPLLATGNHRFLTRKRGERPNEKAKYPVSPIATWEEAKGLRNSDLLCFPKPNLPKKDIPVIDLFKYGSSNTVRCDKDIVWTETGSNHIKRTFTRRYLDMSDLDIAWLGGVYVGNGWSTIVEDYEEGKHNRYSMGVCFHSEHKDDIERAINALGKLVGKEHVHTFKGYKGKKVVQIVIENQFLANFFVQSFGKHAINKHVPDFYMTSGNDEVIREFMKGLWCTDGHVSDKTPEYKYSSTSTTLIEQLSILMMEKGFFGNQQRRVHKDKKNWNDEYTLKFNGGQIYGLNDYFGFNGKTKSHFNQFEQDDKYFYFKVRKVEEVKVSSEKVYDLTVANNHSYIVNNTAVHNCTGSLIAYLCHQTEMDSVKLGLNFERFMNPERISLSDIDVDWASQDQQWIQRWMLTNDRWYAASILTTNTYGLKGAIKAIADGMDKYAGKPQYIQSIRNQIDDKGNYSNSLYEEHKELFDNAKQIVGVIDSFGRHAAGVLIDTNTIDDHVGIQTISKWDYPVTQVTMKEIDHYNWVKFDMLGLDNVGLISKACKLAGLPYLTPDSTDIVDFEDKKVWNSMRDNNIGIFQFEADRAGQILKDLFADDTIDKIENGFDNNKRTKVRYMDLLSLANAAQRPSGASYLYNVTHGIVKDNGHPALNEFLAPTLGNLVYQEQILNFLVEFCGYTAGAADVIRRGIGKKLREVIDEEVPKIHKAFVKTMTEKYGDSTEHAEKVAKDFMQVFMDAANYGFSINHSMAYSYIGYISTWLRYYYPLEWGTAACEIWKDKPEKIAKVTSYLESRGINIKPARFRKSRALYYMDKETNSIYEGIEPIKRVNEKAGEQLYSLRDNQYDTFTDLLLDIYEPIKSIQESNYATNLTELYKLSSEKVKEIDKLAKCNKNIFIKKEKCVEVNKSIMLNLISLNYFDEFGGSKLLADTYEKFIKIYKPKNKTLINKQKAYLECLEFERTSANIDFPLDYQLKQQLELKGKISYSNDKLPNTYVFVTDLAKMSNRYKLNIYSLKTGKISQILVSKRNYISQKIEIGDFINIKKVIAKPKIVNVNGKWTKSEDEREFWLEVFSLINLNKKDDGV